MLSCFCVRYSRVGHERRSEALSYAQRPAPAAPVSVGPLSAAAVSQDALFHRLHQLLTEVDTDALGQCPRQLGVGGRCFDCLPTREDVMSWIDGRKPVCLDLLQPNCSVLSFGVNHDFSFEEAMEDLGCAVHAFDPTMGVESYRRSRGIHFHSLGIGPSDTEFGGFPVASLGSIARRTRLQRGVVDYLKLDVETSEWEALHQQLTTAGDLLRVKQLNVEFHLFQWQPVITEGVGMRQLIAGPRVPYEDALRFAAVLEALRKAGFGLASSDPNTACHQFAGGCLSILYNTHWVNTNINSMSVEWGSLQLYNFFRVGILAPLQGLVVSPKNILLGRGKDRNAERSLDWTHSDRSALNALYAQLNPIRCDNIEVPGE